MKLQITLTDTMVEALALLCKRERRTPRQQAEVLLEQALEEAMRPPQAPPAHAQETV